MNAWEVSLWSDLLAIAQTVVLAVIAVMGLWLKSFFPSRKEFRELEKRVAVVEVSNAIAPDPARVTDMQTSIARLTASIDALLREMEALDNRLDRIETHLLQQARS